MMEFQYHFELLPNLCSIQICLVAPSFRDSQTLNSDSNETNCSLSIRPSSYEVSSEFLKIKWGTESFYLIRFPCKVRPKTLQSYKVTPGNTIEFKLSFETEEFQIYKNSLIEKTSQTHSIRQLKQFRNLYCRFCKSRLLQENRIKAVNELPSDTWFELVDNCSCNPDHFASTHPADGHFEAKKETILVSDTFYQVHNDEILHDQIFFETNTIKEWNKIQCNRCYFPLGEGLIPNQNKKGSMKFNKNLVLVDPNEIYSLEKNLASEIFLTSKDDAIYHFYIKNIETNQVVLFVWLLSWETLIATNSNLDNPLDPNQNQDYLPNFFPVIKVLYQDLLESSLSSTYPNAFVLSLSNDDCLEILFLLKKSTLSLPPLKRNLNGFCVGYLKK